MRTKSSVGSLRRRLAAVFGFLAIYVNLLASVAAAPISFDALRPEQIAESGSVGGVPSPTIMVICGPDGRIVSVPFGGGDDHHRHCVFCMPLLSAAIAVPDADTTLKLDFAIVPAPVTLWDVQDRPNFLVSSLRARAPPAV